MDGENYMNKKIIQIMLAILLAFDENYDFIDEHSFYEIQKNSISKK
jgi:hypothetical protein